MNRRLRKRHQAWVASLAVLLPLGLGLALYARPSYKVSASATADTHLDVPAGAGLDAGQRWAELELELHVWPADSTRGGILELCSAQDLALPDVLLYWGAHSPEQGELDGTEYLLGSFFGTHKQRFSLPASASQEGLVGSLILYSLAHNQVIDSADLMGLEE